MQAKKLNILKKLSQKLNSPINICKICLQNFEVGLLNEIFFKNNSICEKCYQEMAFLPQRIKLDDTVGHAMYEYNDKIKSMIFLLKGCGDIEMAPVFLERIKAFIKIYYRNYILVPAPSWEEDDQSRGFNHVKEVFKDLGLPIVQAINKKTNFKQSSLSYNERKHISKKFEINNKCSLQNKKILIIDDIFTSGSTIKAMIELVKKLKPRCINFLVIAIVCRKM